MRVKELLEVKQPMLKVQIPKGIIGLKPVHMELNYILPVLTSLEKNSNNRSKGASASAGKLQAGNSQLPR